jgi:hypothetical protein
VAAPGAGHATTQLDPSRKLARGGLRSVRCWEGRISPGVASPTSPGALIGGALMVARPFNLRALFVTSLTGKPP